MYEVFVAPIVGCFQWLLEYSYTLTGDYGLSILILSLMFNLCLLPFYRQADKLQQKEREIQFALAPKVAEFKSVFNGQERYLMLKALYRQHRYHPVYALRAVIALMIQIPFFIAAYFLFDNYRAMDGHSWLFISNLGQPDQLLYGINILPFVMTGINLAAGFVYVSALTRREGIQVLAIAMIFLVFLYSVPASMVLYWTFNNLFSLGKNLIFVRLDQSRVSDLAHVGRPFMVNLAETGQARAVYALSTAVFLTFLFLVLPIVLASLEEDVNGLQGYLGYFFKWCASAFVISLLVTCFIYFSIPSRWHNYLATTSLSLLLIGLFFAFIFWANYGYLDDFVFTGAENLQPSTLYVGLDIVVVILALLVAAWAYQGHAQRLVPFLSTLLVFGLVYGAYGIWIVSGKADEAVQMETGSQKKIFNYSKTEPNILIFMVDGAMSGYIPYLLEDKPELNKKLDGFTWYSNSVSIANRTISGMPALMGGFGYTPTAINGWAGQKLVDKVNAAYELYPDNFAPKGYDLLYADPFWYGFKRRGDCERLSASADVECVNLIDSVGRREADKLRDEDPDRFRRGLLNQYVVLSLFKMMPSTLRYFIYDDANWMGHSFSWQKKEDKFLINYLTLGQLRRLSDTQSSKPTLTLIVNNVTRANLLLDAHCRPSKQTEPDPFLLQHFGDMDTVEIYQTFSCAMSELAEYLIWFQENDIWNNTMVVFVSDHGWKSNNPILENTPDQQVQSQWQNLLMIKPFNARGAPKESNEFIANANVPGIVCETIGGCFDQNLNTTVTNEPLREPVLLHGTHGQPSGQTETDYIFETLWQVEKDVRFSKNWKQLK